MPTEDLERMIDIMTNPVRDLFQRTCNVKSLMYFAMSYIAALQGVQDNLASTDPLHRVISASLNEIETTLMDR